MRLTIATIALTLALPACALQRTTTGNMIPPAKLAALKPGMTQAEIRALAGSPSTVASLGGLRWLYIASELATPPFRRPQEERRQVVEIAFAGDKAASIRVLGLAEGREVAMNSDETPVAGGDLSVVGQLIGNIGRFNPD
ncbi:outer membrane protein assembly factor BamE [Alphaproteobacteria bacterium]|nr:outer membrane protein assembly factor BamE [Alphaproteobacteria bacterium]